MAETRRPLLRPLARALVVVALAASTVLLAGPRPSPPAGGGGGPAWPDPGRFTTRIDNPFWPMAPGSRWVYRDTGAAGSGRVEVVKRPPVISRMPGMPSWAPRDPDQMGMSMNGEL